jgi:hypothetical protein
MSGDREALIGRDAVEVLGHLVSRSGKISKCFVFEPIVPPLLQQDKTLGSGMGLVDHAISLRSSSGLPFWDALMLLASEAESPPRTLFRSALRHNRPKDNELRSIDVVRFSAESIRTMAASLDSGRLLALQSRVLLSDGTFRHIPMLDFHVKASDQSVGIVETILEVLGMSGFVLSSGKSYHFYGGELLEEFALPGFLGKALLFSPIVDRAWVAHQLMESACALRISPRAEYGGAPRVVARVNRSLEDPR